MDLNQETNKDQSYEYVNKYSKTGAPKWRIILTGLLIIAGGCVAGYFYIYKIITAMAAHASEIKYSFQTALLPAVLIAAGFYVSIVQPASWGGEQRSDNKKDKSGMAVLIIVFIVFAAATYFLLQHFATLYGYNLNGKDN